MAMTHNSFGWRGPAISEHGEPPQKTLVAGTYSPLASCAADASALERVRSATKAILLADYVRHADEWVTADLLRSVYLNCIADVAAHECGIAVDSADLSGTEGSCNQDQIGQQIGRSACLHAADFAACARLGDRTVASGTGL
jgi:hypothetical protein